MSICSASLTRKMEADFRERGENGRAAEVQKEEEKCLFINLLRATKNGGESIVGPEKVATSNVGLSGREKMPRDRLSKGLAGSLSFNRLKLS